MSVENEEECIKLIESKEKELGELSQKHSREIQILENEIKDLKQKREEMQWFVTYCPRCGMPMKGFSWTDKETKQLRGRIIKCHNKNCILYGKEFEWYNGHHGWELVRH